MLAKVGLSLITWGKLEKLRQLMDALVAASEIGYGGVAFEYPWLPEEAKREPEMVKSLLAELGLEAIGIAPDVDDTSLSFGASIGARTLWTVFFSESIDQAVKKTKSFLPLASKLGVKIALHPHLKTCVEREEEVASYLSNFSPGEVGVVFDPAHLSPVGVSYNSFVDRFQQWITLVHLKDLRQRKPPAEVEAGKDFVDIGDGVLDFKSALKALRRVGYNQWHLVEVEALSEGETPYESARKNYERLRALLATER